MKRADPSSYYIFTLSRIVVECVIRHVYSRYDASIENVLVKQADHFSHTMSALKLYSTVHFRPYFTPSLTSMVRLLHSNLTASLCFCRVFNYFLCMSMSGESVKVMPCISIYICGEIKYYCLGRISLLDCHIPLNNTIFLFSFATYFGRNYSQILQKNIQLKIS